MPIFSPCLLADVQPCGYAPSGFPFLLRFGNHILKFRNITVTLAIFVFELTVSMLLFLRVDLGEIILPK